MGHNHSSLSRCKNDFELVIRATKELEWLLETHFNAPSGKDHGLHDKITHARDRTTGQPLPAPSKAWCVCRTPTRQMPF